MGDKYKKTDLEKIQESYYKPEYLKDMDNTIFEGEDIPGLTSPKIVGSISVQ